MSDSEQVTPQDLQETLADIVKRHGIALVANALLDFASGSSIRDILEATERRAIRIAADAEAAETLK